MSKSLQDALGEKPWSVTAVMFDLNDMLDDEGRPISERRADIMVRVGVEMEMRKCQFPGIRLDKWMNVSALEQITRYYNDARVELSTFRSRSAGKDASWDDILAGVIDLLSGPAIYLLQQKSLQGPVPAKIAVGHKLAAGMFGVMRKIHERLATGGSLPVTTDSFMQMIEETNALVGSTHEACAGSLAMIRKACAALVEGSDEQDIEFEPTRLDIARCLATQVQLGIFWQLYDQYQLWRLLRSEFCEHLLPCNEFLKVKIERAAGQLDETPPPQADCSALPDTMTPETREAFTNALNDKATAEQLEKDLQMATDMLQEPGSVIEYSGDIDSFSQYFASYMHTSRLFKTELSRIEQKLRELLHFSASTPIHLGAAAYPTPGTLQWFELILGRKLGSDGHLTGKSTRIQKVSWSKYQAEQ